MTPADLIAATWPPAATRQVGAITLRDGAGGGKRVSAASLAGDPYDVELEASDLYVVWSGEDALDARLADLGYTQVDPTLLLSCDIAALVNPAPPPVSGFTVWPPLQVQREIWADGGIGPERLAVMDRVTARKTAILGRAQDKPAGTAFVAIHDGTAIVHAVEVRDSLRRTGTATHMMRHAARWAQANGATQLAVLVTEANASAIAFYNRLGLTGARCYHYRLKPKDRP